MTDRPVIFGAPMVRALLAGTKTQTRRVIRYPRWANVNEPMEMHDDGLHALARATGCFSRVPIRYAPGDRLWVREAWGMNRGGFDVPAPIPKVRPARDKLRDDQIVYFATETDSEILAEMPRRPSIHMPRWASRLTLAVTGVRVERLNDISRSDAIAEGCDGTPGHDTVCDFSELWESLHGTGSWDANPWVVAITFTVHLINIDNIRDAPR